MLSCFSKNVELNYGHHTDDPKRVINFFKNDSHPLSLYILKFYFNKSMSHFMIEHHNVINISLY